MKQLRLLILLMVSMATAAANAQNPYLPLWEYIPDGEPYVFEDPDCPGKFRVYVYGSHDSLIKEYCGLEQVVWSAPVDDLTNWRYDGIIFKADADANGRKFRPDGKGDLLYAPDVAVTTDATGKKTYYLYPNNQVGGRQGMVAKSDRPDGPFVVCNWSKQNPGVTDGVLRFDPGVFVDDDGRVYGYWGFEESWGAELDPQTMATVKPGTEAIKDMVSNYHQEGIFRFFEASSIRKIEDKYVFIYSRWTEEGEFGLPTTNYTLAYAYGDSPLGPWTYGGTIIDGRARGTDLSGKTVPTAHPTGNTHGSICKIAGKWWVFYHRQSGLDEFARQAMVAPITVKVEKGKGGKVYISEGEVTSEGFQTDGLNPLCKTPAGIACYYVGPKPAYNDYPKFIFSGSHTQPTYRDENSYEGPFNQKQPFTPMVNNTNGSTIGYKYFNLNHLNRKSPASILFHLVPEGTEGTIRILLGSPWTSKGGKEIGRLTVSGNAPEEMTAMTAKIDGWQKLKGKQALYFVFESSTSDKSICRLYDFQFIQ
ncbi:MAG: family 43 glycosylhydrolase [Bacteroidaceae bacterium]|nr:family 43 glycosylhydrolase [Bacteroidaceae bacterium]